MNTAVQIVDSGSLHTINTTINTEAPDKCLLGRRRVCLASAAIALLMALVGVAAYVVLQPDIPCPESTGRRSSNSKELFHKGIGAKPCFGNVAFGNAYLTIKHEMEEEEAAWRPWDESINGIQFDNEADKTACLLAMNKLEVGHLQRWRFQLQPWNWEEGEGDTPFESCIKAAVIPEEGQQYSTQAKLAITIQKIFESFEKISVEVVVVGEAKFKLSFFADEKLIGSFGSMTQEGLANM